VTAVDLHACGRTDDGRFAVLRQGEQRMRWPDPDRALDAEGLVRMTISPGRQFAVRGAGSAVFFTSTELEFCLFFPDLLPALPARCDVTCELLPAEVNEGSEEAIPQ
jgi:hypothetical protein